MVNGPKANHKPSVDESTGPERALVQNRTIGEMKQ